MKQLIERLRVGGHMPKQKQNDGPEVAVLRRVATTPDSTGDYYWVEEQDGWVQVIPRSSADESMVEDSEELPVVSLDEMLQALLALKDASQANQDEQEGEQEGDPSEDETRVHATVSEEEIEALARKEEAGGERGD